MKILYLYRAKSAGPSIRRVFQPIAKSLSKNNDVTSLFIPHEGASFTAIRKNIQFVKHHLKTNHYDVIHVTGDVYYLLWGLRKQNVVVTIHDLLFYFRIKNRLKKRLMYLLELFPLRYAKEITFISKSSRDEACKLLDFQKKNVHIIPNPINSAFTYIPKIINSENPEILHIGTKPNKNLGRVLDAIKDIKCRLHIIGAVNLKINRKIQELSINAKVEIGLTDDQILQSYRDCDIVSFPSLYEGFGMPIIEGQMTGRKVVTSNISPMNEVAGGAAILVDPENVESIKKGFLLALENDNQIVTRGLSNARQYSVTTISKKYFDLYKSTIQP